MQLSAGFSEGRVATQLPTTALINTWSSFAALYKPCTNTGIWKAGRASKKDEKERKKARAEGSMAWKGERNVSPWARFCVNQSIKIVDVPTADIIRHVWVSRLEIRKCRLNWRDYIYEPRVNMTALKWTWHAPARCVFSNSRTQAELRVPRSTDREFRNDWLRAFCALLIDHSENM